MRLIKSMRRQNAIYWQNLGPDSSGTNTFQQPTQIKVRWEDVMHQFVQASGEVIGSETRVYVGIDMKVGDALELGTLDSTYTDNPDNHDKSGIIRGFDKIPTLKANDFVRIAHL